MILFVAAFAVIGGLYIIITNAAPGGCSTANVLGTAQATVTVPETTQYHVWARMQVPNTTNTNNLNGVRVELAGSSTQCFTVTTTSSSAVSGWQWINSDATAASTKLTTSSMTAGNYTLKILGLREGVKVDKIILSKASDNCTPSNTISGSVMPGDNCTTPKPVVNISASPTSITSGSSSTITWSSTNATGCTASGGSGSWAGARATAGNFSTGNLTSSQTYTIVCNGVGGSSDSKNATVTVNTPSAPTVTFSASPSTITSGSSSVLTWSSTNATGCTASGGWSGGKATTGTQGTGTLTATRTYNLSCTGPGGSVNAGAVTVTVNAAPPPVDQEDPTVTMEIPGVTVPSGESSVVVGDETSITWRPLAADNVSVTSFVITVNGQPVTLTNGSYTFGAQSNGNGNYVLRAVATDANGNTTESTVTIKLRHPDFNRDGRVNSTDFNGLLRTWGQSSTNYDLNDSGTVNSSDFNVLLRNWGNN